MKKIAVESLPITLAQFLKWSGLAQTGSEAKALVREGLVLLNGQVCQVAGRKLAPGDRIRLDNLNEEELELCLA